MIATKRALRRFGRDGDCPAPREDSAAVEATRPPDRRSANPGNISARSDLGVLGQCSRTRVIRTWQKSVEPFVRCRPV